MLYVTKFIVVSSIFVFTVSSIQDDEILEEEDMENDLPKRQSEETRATNILVEASKYVINKLQEKDKMFMTFMKMEKYMQRPVMKGETKEVPLDEKMYMETITNCSKRILHEINRPYTIFREMVNSPSMNCSSLKKMMNESYNNMMMNSSRYKERMENMDKYSNNNISDNDLPRPLIMFRKLINSSSMNCSRLKQMMNNSHPNGMNVSNYNVSMDRISSRDNSSVQEDKRKFHDLLKNVVQLLVHSSHMRNVMNNSYMRDKMNEFQFEDEMDDSFLDDENNVFLMDDSVTNEKFNFSLKDGESMIDEKSNFSFVNEAIISSDRYKRNLNEDVVDSRMKNMSVMQKCQRILRPYIMFKMIINPSLNCSRMNVSNHAYNEGRNSSYSNDENNRGYFNYGRNGTTKDVANHSIADIFKQLNEILADKNQSSLNCSYYMRHAMNKSMHHKINGARQMYNESKMENNPEMKNMTKCLKILRPYVMIKSMINSPRSNFCSYMNKMSSYDFDKGWNPEATNDEFSKFDKYLRKVADSSVKCSRVLREHSIKAFDRRQNASEKISEDNPKVNNTEMKNMTECFQMFRPYAKLGTIDLQSMNCTYMEKLVSDSYKNMMNRSRDNGNINEMSKIGRNHSMRNDILHQFSSVLHTMARSSMHCLHQMHNMRANVNMQRATNKFQNGPGNEKSQKEEMEKCRKIFRPFITLGKKEPQKLNCSELKDMVMDSYKNILTFSDDAMDDQYRYTAGPTIADEFIAKFGIVNGLNSPLNCSIIKDIMKGPLLSKMKSMKINEKLQDINITNKTYINDMIIRSFMKGLMEGSSVRDRINRLYMNVKINNMRDIMKNYSKSGMSKHFNMSNFNMHNYFNMPDIMNKSMHKNNFNASLNMADGWMTDFSPFEGIKNLNMSDVTKGLNFSEMMNDFNPFDERNDLNLSGLTNSLNFNSFSSREMMKDFYPLDKMNDLNISDMMNGNFPDMEKDLNLHGLLKNMNLSSMIKGINFPEAIKYLNVSETFNNMDLPAMMNKFDMNAKFNESFMQNMFNNSNVKDQVSENLFKLFNVFNGKTRKGKFENLPQMMLKNAAEYYYTQGLYLNGIMEKCRKMDEVKKTVKTVLTATVKMSVSFNDNFTKELENKSSSAYKKKEEEISRALAEQYNTHGAHGEFTIIIHSLSNGSIVVNYTVEHKTDATNVSSDILTEILDNATKSLNISILNIDPNKTVSSEIVIKEINVTVNSTVENKTSEAENKTSEEENKTANRTVENKTSEEENKTSEEENKTSEEENKTSEEENKTSEEENKTSEEENKTSEEENKTSEEENKTSETETKASNTTSNSSSSTGNNTTSGQNSNDINKTYTAEINLLLVREIPYITDYDNESSPAYIKLDSETRQALTEVLNLKFKSSIVARILYKKGSVEVLANATVISENNVTSNEILKIINEAAKSGNMSNLNINTTKTETKILSVKSNNETSSEAEIEEDYWNQFDIDNAKTQVIYKKPRSPFKMFNSVTLPIVIGMVCFTVIVLCVCSAKSLSKKEQMMA